MTSDTLTLSGYYSTLPRYRKVVMDWLSDASAGTVAKTTTQKFSGRLVCVEFVPGSATPTDAYDVTIKDDQGIDILIGGGANVPQAGAFVTTGASSVPFPTIVDTTLALAVANAGNSKTGKIILIFEQRAT